MRQEIDVLKLVEYILTASTGQKVRLQPLHNNQPKEERK